MQILNSQYGKAHGFKFKLDSLEKISKPNVLTGNLAQFNNTLCHVCGNVLKIHKDIRQGLHKNCAKKLSEAK